MGVTILQTLTGFDVDVLDDRILLTKQQAPSKVLWLCENGLQPSVDWPADVALAMATLGVWCTNNHAVYRPDIQQVLQVTNCTIAWRRFDPKLSRVHWQAFTEMANLPVCITDCPELDMIVEGEDTCTLWHDVCTLVGVAES